MTRRATGVSVPRRRPPGGRKLREQAYESFTRHLLARSIRPGQFVSQRELVELTGLPLGAIRELVPRLEADGLITTVPQRGMQVAHIDLKLVRNAFQLRAILEKEALVHFAATAPATAVEALIAAHRRIIDAAQAGEVGDTLLDDAQAVDWNLHDTLIDSLDNEIVTNVYRVNSIKIRLIRQERVRLTPDLLLPAMHEHLRILDALRAGDVPRAIEALGVHLERARERAMR